MKILLVEDEEALARFIRKGIMSESFNIDVAYDGRTGKSYFKNRQYDIVVLDINIPVINGFELCRLFKAQNPNVPILLLSALDSIEDKTEGFESGADDYLVKPFEFKELLLRIRALTNRVHLNTQIGKVLQIQDLELDQYTKTVLRSGKLIELTSKEFDLLEYLMINQGKVITRVDIAEKVWGLNFDTNTNVIDVYINYLRNKVDKNFEPKLIQTVVGKGYILKGMICQSG